MSGHLPERVDVLKNLDVLAKRYPPQRGLPSNESLCSPLQLEFIDWLLDPQRQGSQRQWAKDHELAEHTVLDWKRTQWFVKVWRERAEKLNGGPERIQNVVDSLYQASLQDWRAAQAYLAWVDKTSPPPAKKRDDSALSDMSDEEFEAILKAHLERNRGGEE